MSKTKSTPSLESTLKSLDTEEFIDIHFYRPIGYQWALFFNSGRYLFLFPEPRYQRDRHVTVNLGKLI